MSEYEETDSLTLAVAESIFKAHDKLRGSLMVPFNAQPWRSDYIAYAEAAIKAYELHQSLTRADLP